jgi:hypothetical protein
VPVAKSGGNSYRNLVSCCLDCNSRKKDLPAEDFLRRLYREGRLSAKDLSARLLAVQALAAGKLRPRLSTEEDAGNDRGKEVRKLRPCGLSVGLSSNLAADGRARRPALE